MRHFLLACVLASSVALLAQEPDVAPKRQSDIIAITNVVIAPTTVVDANGNQVSDLKIEDFTLLDNGKPQRLQGEIAFNPISLVVAIQASAQTEAVLPKLKGMGSLLEGLILGDRGEAAILAFDHRIQTIQEFTRDSTKLKKAVTELKTGSRTAVMYDAVQAAVRMLRDRPKDHRKIVLLIAETRDRGSEGRLRDVLTAAEIGNVTVYTMNVARMLTALTTPVDRPRPHPIPPTARAPYGGAAVTPNTMEQQYGGAGYTANFVPLLEEIFRGVKSIFIDNHAEVLTRYTGGREYDFASQGALEKAFVQLGNELHSQYLLAYQPTNTMEGGYHQIQVVVRRPDLEVRTRPGYWLAATQ